MADFRPNGANEPEIQDTFLKHANFGVIGRLWLHDIISRPCFGSQIADRRSQIAELNALITPPHRHYLQQYKRNNYGFHLHG
jgi:hypothetical protein